MPSRETRSYRGEVLPAPFQGPLRRAGVCQGQADSNRYRRFVCVECDPQPCHRSSIAQRLIERHRVRIEHQRPLCRSPLLKQELGLLLCGGDTRGVRLLAVPDE